MTDLSSILGASSLFIGVESQTWSLADFQAAAQFAKELGISALIIKIADGTNVWYSGLGGWQRVLETVKAEGLLAVPYAYCYGETFGALQGEIAILEAVMSSVGMVIADMEVEWNGKTDWATSVSNALKDKSGIFAVTTWADPSLQNWQGVLEALKPVVDLWLPQVYSDFLASVYRQQFAGLPVMPVFNLGNDVGPNDLLSNVQAAQGGPMSFWEWQGAKTLSAIMQQIIATQGGIDMPLQISDAFAASHFKETSEASWLCNSTGCNIVSGILNYYRQTQGAFRLPLTDEIYGVIPGGSFQVFESGVLVWDPRHAFDNPGQGDVYAMHLDKDTPGLRRLMALAGAVMPAVTAEHLASAVTAVKTAEANLAVALSDLEPVHS